MNTPTEYIPTIDKQPEPRSYIGDGVYVRYDGFAYHLTSENGIEVLNLVVLEPEVLAALNRFVEKVTRGAQPEQPAVLHEHVSRLISTQKYNAAVASERQKWLSRNAGPVGALAAEGINGSICELFGRMEFGHLTHPQVIRVLQQFPGRWKKDINYNGTTIDYTLEHDGMKVCCYGGEPPPSCKIVEVEEEVPAQPATTRKVRKLKCVPAVTAPDEESPTEGGTP